MSVCGTPYATGSGHFPPVKRCTRRARFKGASCPEHTLQLHLMERPGNAALLARYRKLVAAFEHWETTLKETRGDSGGSVKVRNAALAMLAAAKGDS